MRSCDVVWITFCVRQAIAMLWLISGLTNINKLKHSEAHSTE